MADQDNHQHADRIDRRGFLTCMAWAGTRLVWTFSGGVRAGCATVSSTSVPGGDFSFAQISDSHIAFDKAPNQDVTVTFQQAVDQINALTNQPAFLLHTGEYDVLATMAKLIWSATARAPLASDGRASIIWGCIFRLVNVANTLRVLLRCD